MARTAAGPAPKPALPEPKPALVKLRDHCFPEAMRDYLAKHHFNVPTEKQIREYPKPRKFYLPAQLLFVNQHSQGNLMHWTRAFSVFDDGHDPDHEDTQEQLENDSWVSNNVWKDRDAQDVVSGAALLEEMLTHPPDNHNPYTKRYHPIDGLPFGRDAEWIGDQLFAELQSMSFNIPSHSNFLEVKTSLGYYTPFIFVQANINTSLPHGQWLQAFSLILGPEDAAQLLNLLSIKLKGRGKTGINGLAIKKAFYTLKVPQYTTLPQFNATAKDTFKGQPIPPQPDLPPQDPLDCDEPDESGTTGAVQAEVASSDLELDEARGQADDEDEDDEGGEDHNSDNVDDYDDPAEKSYDGHEDQEKSDAVPQTDKRSRECLTIGSDNFALPYPLQPKLDSEKLPAETEPYIYVTVPTGLKSAMDEVRREEFRDAFKHLAAFVKPLPNMVNGVRIQDRAVWLGNKYCIRWLKRVLIFVQRVHEEHKIILGGRRHHSPDLRQALYGENQRDPEGTKFKAIFLDFFERAHRIAIAQDWAARNLSNAGGGSKNEPAPVAPQAKVTGRSKPAPVRKAPTTQQHEAIDQSPTAETAPLAQMTSVTKQFKIIDQPPTVKMASSAQMAPVTQQMAVNDQPSEAEIVPITSPAAIPAPEQFQTLALTSQPADSTQVASEENDRARKSQEHHLECQGQGHGVEDVFEDQSQNNQHQATDFSTKVTDYARSYPQKQAYQPQVGESTMFSHDPQQNHNPAFPTPHAQQWYPNQYHEVPHHQSQHSYGITGDPSNFTGGQSFGLSNDVHGFTGDSFDPPSASQTSPPPYDDNLEFTEFKFDPITNQAISYNSYPVYDRSDLNSTRGPPFAPTMQPPGLAGPGSNSTRGQSLTSSLQPSRLPGLQFNSTRGQSLTPSVSPSRLPSLAPISDDHKADTPRVTVESGSPPLADLKSESSVVSVKDTRKRKAPEIDNQPSQKKSKTEVNPDPNLSEGQPDFVSRYRQEMAKENSKLKDTWSTTLHDGMGIAQGDFGVDATMNFIRSHNMNSDQRKILVQLVESFKGIGTMQESAAFFDTLVTAAFRAPNPRATETFKLSRKTWRVTGSIGVYKDRPLTIAHALTVVWREHGVEAMNEAARAFATFKIYAPNSNTDGMYPIDNYDLKGSHIATAIWPDKVSDKAAQVRRLTQVKEEIAEEKDLVEQWPEIHMQTVATVMQRHSLPKEYPTVEVMHEDTEQEIKTIDGLLTTTFFAKTIVPALEAVWPEGSLNVEALWDAVMTDGERRENPWSKVVQQGGSPLGEMARAKTKKKPKPEKKPKASTTTKTPTKPKGKAKTKIKDKNEDEEEGEDEDLEPELFNKGAGSSEVKVDPKPRNKLKAPKSVTVKADDMTTTPTPSTTKKSSATPATKDFMERLRKNGPGKTLEELKALSAVPNLPVEARSLVTKWIKAKAVAQEQDDELGNLADQFGL
jgi:hypothetical protein